MPAPSMMGNGVHVRSAVELRTIARELKEMGDRKVLAQFRRELRIAAAPLVPAVRASIAHIPVTTTDKPYRPKGLKAGQAWSGGERASLRSLLMRATRLYIRTGGRLTGIVIMVDGRKMPPGMRNLQKYMEGTKPHWRHPVFGHWVAGMPDQPAHPYFYPVVDKLGPLSIVAVDRACRRITNDITGRPYLNVP